jgi:hypothetical protein
MPCSAAEVRFFQTDDLLAAFGLTQCAQYLLFRVTLLRHLRVLLFALNRTTSNAPHSTYRWPDFRVLGQKLEVRSNEISADEVEVSVRIVCSPLGDS